MIGQSFDAFSHSNVPHFYERIVTACNNVWLILLSHHWTNCVSMTNQWMDLSSNSDVPNSGGAVSASCDEHTQALVNFEAINTTQVAVIASDDFVHFQIPTFYWLIFATRKKIRVSFGELNATNRVDMTSQRYFQLSWSQVPKLNCSIDTACREESITGRNSYRSDPTLMSNNDSIELEWRSPFGLDQLSNISSSDGSHFGGFSEVHL